MKRLSFIVLAVLMLASIVIGCSGNNNSENNASNTNAPAAQENSGNSAATEEPAKKDPVTIKMFQFKVEIADALNKMVAEYEKETGNKVEVETHGGGEDYSALLRAEFAGGSEPEIFNNGGFAGLQPYLDRATDLTGEAWFGNLVEASKAPTTVDGKLYGMPMNLEGYGLIYNKDLFAQAGITEEPKTLSQLKDAVAKLNAAGITPFESTTEWWSLGIHLVNVAFANQADPAQFIEDVKAGKATIKDNDVFKQWVDLVDLIFKNAQKELLTTDYATQVANFASGKAAMMQQGNWTQGDIDKVNPNLNLGILPLPINDQEGKVLIGVPNNWVVNSKSAHPEVAKEFLNWMVTSETGKKYIAQDFKFMPAFNNIDATATDIGQIAVALKEKASNAVGWHWDRFPDGVTQGFGAAMQEYQFGKTNGDELLAALDKAVQDIVNR